MSLLGKFPHLRILSLHGNHLQMIPLMTNLQLTHLDISKNPIQIDSYLLDSLYSLTTLEHLVVDGTSEELDRIVENLPNLKTLNGSPVIRERRVDPNKNILQKMKSNLYLEKDKLEKMTLSFLKKFQPTEKADADFSSSFDEILIEYKEFMANVVN